MMPRHYGNGDSARVILSADYLTRNIFFIRLYTLPVNATSLNFMAAMSALHAAWWLAVSLSSVKSRRK